MQEVIEEQKQQQKQQPGELREQKDSAPTAAAAAAPESKAAAKPPKDEDVDEVPKRYGRGSKRISNLSDSVQKEFEKHTASIAALVANATRNDDNDVDYDDIEDQKMKKKTSDTTQAITAATSATNASENNPDKSPDAPSSSSPPAETPIMIPGAYRMFPSNVRESLRRRDEDNYEEDIQIGGGVSSSEFTRNSVVTKKDESEKFLSAFLVVEEAKEDIGGVTKSKNNAQREKGGGGGEEEEEEIDDVLFETSTSAITVMVEDSTSNHSLFSRPSYLLPSSAVQVDQGEEISSRIKKRNKLLLVGSILALFLVIVGLVVGLTITTRNKDGRLYAVLPAEDYSVVSSGPPEGDSSVVSSSSSSSLRPAANTTTTSITTSVITISTTEQIQTNGFLKCGHRPPPESIFPKEESNGGKVPGFDAQLCYAIGAALQVDVEFVDASGANPFDLLANRTVDVLTRARTHTMQRTLYEISDGAGYAFSAPYLYTGLQAAGDPYYVTNCADKNFRHIGEDCSNLKVCVQEASTHQKILDGYLTSRKVIPRNSLDALRKGLAGGSCNVIVHEGHNLAESLVREAGYNGDYILGSQLYSKEPLAIVTRSDDPVFSAFVNSVLQALMTAEEMNVTQSLAHEFPPMKDNSGDTFPYYYMINPNAYQDAIAAGGNYGELYEKFFEPLFPRQAVNRIYLDDTTMATTTSNHTTGLLYAHPFGNVATMRATNHPLGPKLQSLLHQGFLRCGIPNIEPGVAWWESLYEEGGTQSVFSGMAIDYCRAISASLFSGETDNLQLVPISDIEEASQVLRDGLADVVAGVHWTVDLEMQFSLTQPFFYGTSAEDDAVCLMTMQDDHEWSAFVYWILAATIYAEEKGIRSAESHQMPEVGILGPHFLRMLRDPILVVGNYADIYQRNMEGLLPRQAPNILNGDPVWGPQHYPPRGFV